MDIKLNEHEAGYGCSEEIFLGGGVGVMISLMKKNDSELRCNLVNVNWVKITRFARTPIRIKQILNRKIESNLN